MTRKELTTALLAIRAISPFAIEKEMAEIDAELDHRFTKTILIGDWVVTKEGEDDYDFRRL